MPELTELDHCVLGVVWREGPLSTYGVRAQFAASTTATWSSSSGSIYPSIRRLIASGLVVAGEASDRRGTQLLRISPAGLERLRAWLSDLPSALGSATADPLRTRAQFITSLPPQQRERFLAEARAHTEAALADLQRFLDKPPQSEADRLEHLGDMGAMLELRARLQWLDYVDTWLRDRGSP